MIGTDPKAGGIKTIQIPDPPAEGTALHPQEIRFPYLAIAVVAAATIILFWGGIYAVAHPDKMFRLARVRRSLLLFVWITVLALTMLFIPACDITLIAIIAVPLGTLLTFALNILPNNHSTIAYWLLLLLFFIHLFVE